MFVGVFFVFVTILTSVYGTCQSLDGQSVPWWILYQQKERPFFHQYVDSTNSHRIKEHYPERRDSVISRVMSSVIDKEEAEFIIYSSDLVNVKDIAGKTSIPTYSKWMHGILGTTSSWKSGFWILHNNLLFPALTNGALSVPGSKAWYATTVGDSSTDLFYICLTAENKGNITEMLISIMAGNPFIYKKKLQNYDFLQPYFKEVRPLQTSFGYEMSATMFLNCMYTPRRNVSANCLFTYAVTTGVGINVFTRPRGMIKHSSAFCYEDQSLSVFDFLKLEPSSSLKSGFTHSLFALSDKTGTTCFGQDVAANAETVAVMICATLPKVHRNIIKSGRLTQWSCRRENTNLKHNTEISNFPVVQQKPFSKPSIEKNEGGKTSNTALAYTADSYDEKNETKFCQMHDCKINEDTQNKQQMINVDALKNPFMKNQKTADWFNTIANDIRMQHIIENPRKKQKINKQANYNAIKIKGSLEVSRFLLKNVKAVLGLFCREGCSFCQNVKEQFIWLTKSIQTDDLDYVIVDILEPTLPAHLQVPFTPYVRYKPSGISEWINYSGGKYDLESILTFLHNKITARRFISNDNATSDGEKDTDNSSNLGISGRKRRETREYFEGANFRIRRELHQDFLTKHIRKFDGTITSITEGEALQLLKDLNEVLEKNKIKRRWGNSFLLTNNKGDTLEKIKNITENFFTNIDYENVPSSRIKFPDFNIREISATLIHIEEVRGNRSLYCGYTTDYNISIHAALKNGNFTVDHFDNKVYKDKQKLKNCPKLVPHPLTGHAGGVCFI